MESIEHPLTYWLDNLFLLCLNTLAGPSLQQPFSKNQLVCSCTFISWILQPCSISPVSLFIEPAGEYILFCSYTGMLKIHQSDICVNVQVPRPWLDKRSSAQMSILYKVFGCRCTNSILLVLYSAMTQRKGLRVLVSVIILYILKYPFLNSPHNILPLLISKYPFRKIKEEKVK